MKPAASTSPATGHILLYDQRHARRQFGKTLGHIAPALVLVSGILPVITGAEPLTLLLGIEFGVGAAYVLLMLRELLHLRHNPFHREPVAWLELAAAGILALEGYHIWHRHHEADLLRGVHTFHTLPYLYGLVALLFVGIAFGHHPLKDRRHLHLHDEGFSGRLHPLGRRFHFHWPEVTAVEPVGPTDLVVVHTNGQRQQLSFSKLHEGAGHRDRLVAHAAARLRKASGSLLAGE
jgi:hypothetical protein